MPAPESITTIEALLALPEDGTRHELLDGEHVVTPAPSWSHQRAVAEILLVLSGVTREDDVFEVLTAPADVQLGPRTLVQPDVFVVRSPRGVSQMDWKDMPTPLMAVEILSPSTAYRDRGSKRRIYLDAGVAEYWIVDVDGEIVERWQPGDERPEMLEDRAAWTLSGGATSEVDLRALFRRIKR